MSAGAQVQDNEYLGKIRVFARVLVQLGEGIRDLLEFSCNYKFNHHSELPNVR